MRYAVRFLAFLIAALSALILPSAISQARQQTQIETAQRTDIASSPGQTEAAAPATDRPAVQASTEGKEIDQRLLDFLQGASLLLFVLYFLPTIVAALRGHLSVVSIFILNVVFGWTFIGWIIALIWSFTGNTKRNMARWRS